MIDWNAYRAAYPRMSYAEVAAFHAGVWQQFPDQEYHSAPLLAGFFDRIRGPLSVVEIGGWRGEAAARTLAARPDITRWHNFEICADAVARPVTPDPRYAATCPDRWPWELPVVRADAAVLAHVIEHMTGVQLGHLVGWLDVRHVYVEAPIRDRARSWRNSTSAHVLEIGWRDVLRLFRRRGFHVAERFDEPPERTVMYLAR